MKAFIYQWTNNLNQKKYIGSHIGEENDGYIGSGKYFRNAYDKNPYVFTRKILEVIDINDKSDIAVLEEQYLTSVDAANNPEYYNISNSYFGGDTYSNRSKEDRYKSMRKTVLGAKKHRIDNPEFWKEAYKKSGITRRQKSKLIYQFDIDGNFIRNYNCIEEVYEDLRISKGNLHSALNGTRNIAGGFRWSFNNYPNAIIKKKIGRPRGSKNTKKIVQNHKNIVTVQVLQYSLDGKLLKTWDSAKEAADKLGISAGSIRHFINGRIPKSGHYANFVWKKGKQLSKTIYKT